MSDSSINGEPDWKQLEHLVADIQRKLAPDAKVSHNVKLPGIQSETERQIDVLVEQSVGQYSMRVVIDCKDYSKPVDVKGIEEFSGLVQDVGAQRGALVCPKGFTKAAKLRAKKLQLDLYSPVDTAPHKWTAKVTAPVLCDFRTTYMAFRISVSAPMPFMMPTMDFYNYPIFDKDKNLLGSTLENARKNWDFGHYPIEPGEHQDLQVFFDQEVLMDNGYGTLVNVDLSVSLAIERRLYFGHLEIKQISGLKDEQTGGIVTNAFTTDVLSAETVQKEWEVYESEEELPVQPMITVVGLDCFGYGA